MDTHSEIEVRFAREEDLSACAAQDSSVPEEIVSRKIEFREVIVAERGGAIVGYLRFEYLWSRVPFIGLVVVREEDRRQGIGRSMLEFLEKFLRDEGHGVLLSSSKVDEPEAQAWHRGVGFQECGILSGVNEGGVAEVFFRKTLT
jgi:ribosomal protein S18 acetylase RimI-like enzyme